MAVKNSKVLKRKTKIAMIGIWIATTVETRNWKWLGHHKMGKNVLFAL